MVGLEHITMNKYNGQEFFYLSLAHSSAASPSSQSKGFTDLQNLLRQQFQREGKEKRKAQEAKSVLFKIGAQIIF